MLQSQDAEFSILSSSVEETHKVAAEFSAIVPWGSVIGLSGELGAGKTEFVRGFAHGLGIDAGVSSPTFVLEQIYPVKRFAALDVDPVQVGSQRRLSHWDLYRLTGDIAVNEIADQRGDRGVITLVEWADRADWLLNLLCCTVFLLPTEGSEIQRRITFSRVNDSGILAWLNELLKRR